MSYAAESWRACCIFYLAIACFASGCRWEPIAVFCNHTSSSLTLSVEGVEHQIPKSSFWEGPYPDSLAVGEWSLAFPNAIWIYRGAPPISTVPIEFGGRYYTVYQVENDGRVYQVYVLPKDLPAKELPRQWAQGFPLRPIRVVTLRTPPDAVPSTEPDNRKGAETETGAIRDGSGKGKGAENGTGAIRDGSD